MPIYKNSIDSEFRLAIRSLLRQSLPVDIIVGCDGPISSALSESLNRLKRKNNNIFIVCSNENIGLAGILNLLIDFCVCNSYSYIGRMDADDFSVRHRFEKQRDYLLNNPKLLACGSQIIEFNNFKLRCRKKINYRNNYIDLVNEFIYRCPVAHPSAFFHVDFFKKIKYNKNYYLNEDYKLWLDAIEAGIEFGNINQSLLYFRTNDQLFSRRRGLRLSLSEFRIRFENLMMLDKFSMHKFVYSIALFVFRLLPVRLVKLIYGWRNFFYKN